MVQAIDEVDLSGFRFGGANVTAFQLVDRETSIVQSVQQEWNRLANSSRLPIENKLKVNIYHTYVMLVSRYSSFCE